MNEVWILIHEDGHSLPTFDTTDVEAYEKLASLMAMSLSGKGEVDDPKRWLKYKPVKFVRADNES